MTVRQLKIELGARRLRKTGLKKELQERLKAAPEQSTVQKRGVGAAVKATEEIDVPTHILEQICPDLREYDSS